MKLPTTVHFHKKFFKIIPEHSVLTTINCKYREDCRKKDPYRIDIKEIEQISYRIIYTLCMDIYSCKYRLCSEIIPKNFLWNEQRLLASKFDELKRWYTSSFAHSATRNKLFDCPCVLKSCFNA